MEANEVRAHRLFNRVKAVGGLIVLTPIAAFFGWTMFSAASRFIGYPDPIDLGGFCIGLLGIALVGVPAFICVMYVIFGE